MKAIISSQISTDDFLKKLDTSPPLVSKAEVNKFLPKNLQFNSVEEQAIWELTASKKEKQQRGEGLKKLFDLVHRRFCLLDFMQAN